jgi:small subunit ribosomal protein S9
VAAVTYAATGKRKTSVARVRLSPGPGKVSVNGRELEEFFGRKVLQTIAVMPLEATRTAGKFDVIVNVVGGGIAGQAGAIRHGIAKALCIADENLRTPLKRAGFLTRDARVVERKKAGFHKARKKPQFSKR